MSYTHLYGTYRKDPQQSTNSFTMSFKMKRQLPEYFANNLIMIEDDTIIPDRYTGEIMPGVKSEALFFKASYLTALESASPERVVMVKKHMVNNYFVERKTAEEAKVWIRNNTDLVETGADTGVFLVQEADEDLGTEAVYLTIE